MQRDTTILETDTVDSAEPDEFEHDTAQNEDLNVAVFGMGCFWTPDAYFGVREGIRSTMVGYAGGEKEDPTYHALGDHTEVVRLLYDADTIEYDELLDLFLRGHDPSRQQKTQYRSVVFSVDETQAEKARAKIESMNVVTSVEPLDAFYMAENYHQKYRLQHTPSLQSRLKEVYDMPSYIRSTTVTRLNGYVAGWGDIDTFEDMDGLGLEKGLRETVKKLYFRNKHVSC